MVTTHPVCHDVPAPSAEPIVASTNTSAISATASKKHEFLTPTLVSIGIEIGIVSFLVALLLLTMLVMPGDGGNDGGGSGNGTSGQDGTGEFAATGSGSGTGEDETETNDGSSEVSQEVTKVQENPGTSSAQPKSAPSPSSVGTPLSPPEKKSNVFIVQDLPQPAANNGPQGAGGGSGFSDLGDRLLKAGAKTGDVQISLAWNNGNDLDLHVLTPGGEEIFFNRRQSTCNGELDVDMNADGPTSQRPVENVYWPTGESPTGKFRVLVHHYANYGGRDPTRFQVTIKVKGKSQSFSGSLRSGDLPKMVQEFTFP